MVLLAETEDDLQCMLDIVNLWCTKWRLTINREKTQVGHFRKKGMQKSAHNFCFGYNPHYSTLGSINNMDDHMTFKYSMRSLANYASSLGVSVKQN